MSWSLFPGPYPRAPRLWQKRVNGWASSCHLFSHVSPSFSFIHPHPLGQEIFSEYGNSGDGGEFVMPGNKTQSEWCLENVLIDLAPLKNQQVHSLYVLDDVSCNQGRAQVVRCYLDGDEKQTYVAKIFDPVYMRYPSDVTYAVDRDLTNESWAYDEICDCGLDGKYTPKYHGSFEFSLPLLNPPGTPGQSYNGRLILLEDVPGVSMQDLIDDDTIWKIPPQLRLDILASALEIDCHLRFIGIIHQDLAPPQCHDRRLGPEQLP